MVKSEFFGSLWISAYLKRGATQILSFKRWGVVCIFFLFVKKLFFV